MTALAIGSRGRRARGRFGDLPLQARIAAAILLVFIAVALTGPLWAPYLPNTIGTGRPFAPPSPDHLLGTDKLGRDVFSRVVWGTRTVFTLAISATALAVIIGSVLGILAASRGGWLDEMLMRLIDVVISIPPIILALLILGSVGNAPPLVVATVAGLYAPRTARVVRAATLAYVSEDFVAAARLRGEGALTVAVRELLPNVWGTVFVEFSVRSAYAIVFIGSLSFLGFGAAPPAPEWGLMIAEGRATLTTSVWPVLAPALAMAILVIALARFTDGIARTAGQAAKRGPRE